MTRRRAERDLHDAVSGMRARIEPSFVPMHEAASAASLFALDDRRQARHFERF